MFNLIKYLTIILSVACLYASTADPPYNEQEQNSNYFNYSYTTDRDDGGSRDDVIKAVLIKSWGTNNVWNADNHTNGIYFVRMIAGKYINTQKLMLVK